MMDTKVKIENEALKEFMAKGYKDASLRQIVKNASLTTGAFYKYYPTKEALFSGLVGEHAKYIYDLCKHKADDFQKQEMDTQIADMDAQGKTTLDEIVDYIYDHYEPCKLLFVRAEGSEYENFIHRLCSIEDQSTMRFIQDLKQSGREVNEVIDEGFIHMISSGMLSAIYEMLDHDMSKEEACARVQLLNTFYTAGYAAIFNVEF